MKKSACCKFTLLFSRQKTTLFFSIHPASVFLMTDKKFEAEMRATFGDADIAKMDSLTRIRIVSGSGSPFVTVTLINRKGKAYSPERPMPRDVLREATRRQLVLG
jgi:hypothetical protein